MGIPSKFPFVYLRRVWHCRIHKYRVSFSILTEFTSATVHRHLVLLSTDTRVHFRLVADSDIGSYDINIYKYWYHHGVLRQGFLTFWNQESVKFRKWSSFALKFYFHTSVLNDQRVVQTSRSITSECGIRTADRKFSSIYLLIVCRLESITLTFGVSLFIL